MLITATVVFVVAADLLSAGPPAHKALSAAPQESSGPRVDLDDVPAEVFSGSRDKKMLRVQVFLDRARFSPGVIDGLGGGNTRKAIKAFERAEGLEVDGKVDDELVSRLRKGGSDAVLRRYTITEDDAKGPFTESIPESLEKQAELDRLGYTSPQERLAERFHMQMDLLEALNRDADFRKAGTEIIVAAGRSKGIDAKVERIEVDKGANAVRVYGKDDKLLAFYPATVGSKSLPSPSGSMTVKAVARDATFYFDPKDMSWGPDKALEIPGGPNNPVGSTWIDLSEDTYGIHGSPDPHLISKSASHGCVRLTNWDVEELADAVSEGVAVEFVGR